MKSVYRKYFKTAAVVWVVCFVGFLLFFLLVLAPQERLKEKTEKQYLEAKHDADAAKEAAKEETQDKLKAQAKKWDERLRDFVTGEENTANLTFDISQISSSIKLSSFGITPTGSEGIIEIENCEHIFAKHIQVSFNGSFNQFACFLNALERSRPVIFIDTFGITRSSGSSSNHKVDMRLAVLIGKGVEAKKEVDS